MHHVVVTTGLLASADAAQAALQSGGRFLLMISMALFLSYVMFMVGAVLVSSVVGLRRSARARARTAHERPAHRATEPAAASWSVDSAPELRGAGA